MGFTLKFLLPCFLLSVATGQQFPYLPENPNCLRTNPGILDAELGSMDTHPNGSEASRNNFWENVHLVSTRFKRAHYFTDIKIGDDAMLPWSPAASDLPDNNKTTPNFELFLSIFTGKLTDDLDEAVLLYKKARDLVSKINMGGKVSVAGLYTIPKMNTYAQQLQAIEAAFGSRENSSLPIGLRIFDCKEELENPMATDYLKRLQFITCVHHPLRIHTDPKDTADEVIQTCNQHQRRALSKNITAEIMCAVGYPYEGVVGNRKFSVSEFQKFWCRIVSWVKKYQLPRIVMRSAFSGRRIEGSADHGLDTEAGWWRRHSTSEAFVEKVEELPGGLEYENCDRCREPCGRCKSAENCIEGNCVVTSLDQWLNGGVRTCEIKREHYYCYEGEVRRIYYG